MTNPGDDGPLVAFGLLVVVALVIRLLWCGFLWLWTTVFGGD